MASYIRGPSRGATWKARAIQNCHPEAEGGVEVSHGGIGAEEESDW